MTNAPRQVRSVATLERILAAALVEFRAEGFRGAGIAAICKRAGVSAGHLYHFFLGKEAIVAAIVERDRARIRVEIEKLLSSDAPIDAIVNAITNNTLAEDFGLDPVLSLEIYAEAARNPLIAQILHDFAREVHTDAVAMLETLQARGTIATNLDLSAAASLLISLVEGMMVRRTVMDPGGDPSVLAKPLEQMLSGLLSGEC